MPGGFSPRQAWARALEQTVAIGRDPSLTLPVLIDALADRFAAAPALLSPTQQLSFAELAARSRAYACWALDQSLGAGDTICLLMANSPEYMAAWLGITRIGAVAALVNTNLAGASLVHAIALVEPTAIIVGADFAENLDAIRPLLPTRLRCWSFGSGPPGFCRIDEAIAAGTTTDPTALPRPSLADKALYIYTSGTTGMPKAAAVSHYRIMQWSHWFAGMTDTRPGDRLYNCLPMYHSIGGVVATGAALVNGAAVVVRERFSAHRFWDDIADWDCTLFQYIGELCRYLATAPPHPRETAHRLRLCVGNGLRADVWEAFQARFRIPHILEYYAATEGSFSLYNCEGKPGAIGRIPPYLAHRFPVALVKSAANGQPLRDAAGACVACAGGEPGEAIGRLASEPAQPGGRFEGYSDKAASEAKILRDVFAPGDAWFRTGDLMRRDAQGFFYFVDRIGDTFRWKGENVATGEIEQVAGAVCGVVEAVAYGVAIPGSEGRAGMIAIVPGADFDLAALHRRFAADLPGYARPLFLRLCQAIDATATFKPKKHELATAGYDPAATTDPLYIDDPETGAFIRLDAECYRRLQDGRLRL